MRGQLLVLPTDPDAHASADEHAGADPDIHQNVHASTDANEHADQYRYADRDANEHATMRDGVADADADPNGDEHADADHLPVLRVLSDQLSGRRLRAGGSLRRRVLWPQRDPGGQALLDAHANADPYPHVW
jgi:hypothetical protein